MREHTHARTLCFNTTDTQNSHLFPQSSQTIFSSLKTRSAILSQEKPVNLWWSAARGTKGQPVILNTLCLAYPDNIWITLQAGPSWRAETTQMLAGLVSGQWLDRDTAVLLLDQSQVPTGIKLQATCPSFSSNWIKLFSFLLFFCFRNFHHYSSY